MDKIIITIGRQYGAGGRSVAKAISEKLGIPVYDNDLLLEAAKESGYSPDLFKKRDEKRHLFSLAHLFSSQLSDTPHFLGDDTLFQIQSDVMRNIAEKGSCIIIGRCSNYVLRDMPRALHVFLTSPLDVRVSRVVKRMGVDEETAGKIIAKKEKNRIDYYNRYTLTKWGQASIYDLCMDSSILGIEGTADMIIEFAEKTGFLK